MEDKAGIYKIVNKINCNTYYGSTINFKIRFRTHRNRLKSNTHENQHLQNAYNLYDSSDAFEFKIVLICAKENCLYYEQLFLNKYWDGGIICYNISPTAGNTLGKKHSKETKEKLSKSALKRKSQPMLGKNHSEETKNKISFANIGKKRSIEFKNTRAKNMMAEGNHFYGKKHTDEAKKIISQIHVNKIPWNKGIKRTDKEILNISNARKATNSTSGSKNPNSKYKDDQIITVKNLIKNGIQNKIISQQTGVSITTIEKIKANKAWKHIEV